MFCLFCVVFFVLFCFTVWVCAFVYSCVYLFLCTLVFVCVCAGWLGSPPQKVLMCTYALEVFQIVCFPIIPKLYFGVISRNWDFGFWLIYWWLAAFARIPTPKNLYTSLCCGGFSDFAFRLFSEKMSFSGDRTLRCFDFSWFSSIFKFFAEWLGSPFQKILIRPYALEVFQILRFPYVPQSCHFQLFSGVGTLRCLDFTWFS